MNSIPKTRPMIYCPGPDKWLTLGQYVQVVRTAKANLDREFKQGITCWWPCTGRDVVKQFVGGVEDRINQARPYLERMIDFTHPSPQREAVVDGLIADLRKDGEQ